MFKTFREKNILAPDKRPLLLSILCWVMFEIGFGFLLAPFFDGDDPSQMYWYQIANFCASFILTALCFLPFLKESISRTNFKGFGSSLLMGYGINFLLAYAVAIIVYVLDTMFVTSEVNVNQDMVTELLNQKALPMILSTVVLAPITEECLVRGVLFAPICKRSPWLAYVVSAAVFSLLHVSVSIITLAEAGPISLEAAIGLVETFLSYLPSGIALGWMYQRTGTIIGPIALHSVSNLISVVTILWAF